MTKLLLDEKPLVILPRLAAAVGLNEAIILQQIHYWLEKKLHYIGNRYWVYNSYTKWVIQFPFFTPRQIRTAIKKLEELQILVSNNKFNNAWYDRTKWYTIDYEILSNSYDVTLKSNAIDKEVKRRDSEVKRSDLEVSPIPETTTENTTENNTKENYFNEFWNLYDKKTDKEKCKKKFLSLTTDEINKILEHLPGYVNATPDKQFRKNPLTYLNNKNWNDEIIKSRDKNGINTHFKFQQQSSNKVFPVVS